MPYSHVRFMSYILPTVALKKNTHETILYQLQAGMTLSAQEQKAIFKDFPDLDLTAGLVDTEKVRDEKPPIYSVRLLGTKEAIQTVRGDLEVFVRVQRLLTAIELAATTLKSRKDLKTDGVLNIFTAPEFYFRPPDRILSYPEKMYRAIENVLSATIGASEALKDWLIIPGTILWVEDVDHNKLYGIDKKYRVDQSTALLLGGGKVWDEKVEKLRPADSDFVPSRRIIDGEWPDDIEYDGEWVSRAEYLKRQDMWLGINDHVVTRGGVRIGIEICLDHGILKQYPRITGDIPMQLIVACNKRITKDKVCVLKNGTVMRCDGFYGPGVHGEIRKVPDYTPKDASRWEKKTKAVLNPTNMDTVVKNKPSFVELSIPIEADNPLYFPEPEEADSTVWAKSTQCITFFEPQEV